MPRARSAPCGRARGGARPLALAAGLALAAACGAPLVPAPESGLPEWQEPGLVPVPGGVVNAVGGNLSVARRDLSLDTLLGTFEIRARYDAASGAWLWNFEVGYDGATFVDETGARHALGELPDGAPVPGTRWTRVDALSIATRGGLLLHFGPDHRLEHVRWATLAYPRLRFARGPGALEISQCSAAPACAPLFEIALDAGGRPLAATDARSGRRAEFGWDALGRLVVARSPFDLASGLPGFRYEYAGSGSLLTAVTSSEGERVEYGYLPGRRIAWVRQRGEGDPQHEFRYAWQDAAGLHPVLHLNPLGGQTAYWFDAERRLLRMERSEAGEVTTWSWSGRRPASRTLPDGSTTRFSWQGDLLSERIDASGNAVRFEYEPGALNLEDPAEPALRRASDSLGLVEERSYDSFGRLASRANGAGELRSFAWGAGTALASTTAPGGLVQSFPLYGAHGHWLEATGPALDRRLFDPVGNALVPSLVRLEGGHLARGYDAGRELAWLATAATRGGAVVAQGLVRITRRSDGRILAIERPGGGDHALEYDALGRLVRVRERVDGVWRETSYGWDAAGGLVSCTRPNGMREELERDAFGRIVRQRALRGGALEGEAVYGWAAGRLVSSWDSIRGETELHAYDAAGRLSATLYGGGELLVREYDARSRLRGEVFSLPGAGVVADLGYEYDLADRELRLVDRRAGEALIERTVSGGALASVRTAGGLLRSFAYDPVTRQPLGASTVDAAGATVETTEISRSVAASPPRQVLRIDTATPLASTSEEYWLPLDGSLSDPSQLVGNQVFHWEDESGRARAFAYDELGNQVGDSGESFAYNAEGSRLLAAAPADGSPALTYAFDEAGFAVERSGVPLGWTATGRLARFGSAVLEWDLQGRLVSSLVGGVLREHRLFGGRVEGSAAGGASRLDLGEVVLDLASGERRFRHLDLRGQVGFESDGDGRLVAHHRYHPYGPDASFGPEPGPAAFDRGLAVGPLVLLGPRAYDPAVGRFLAPDPALQWLSQYGYTSGNPLVFGDASGLFQEYRVAWRFQADLLFAVAATATAGAVILGTGAPLTPVLLATAAIATAVGSLTKAAVTGIEWLEAAPALPAAPAPPVIQKEIELEIETTGRLHDVGGLAALCLPSLALF
jgi:RHS repeat-associated protein